MKRVICILAVLFLSFQLTCFAGIPLFDTPNVDHSVKKVSEDGFVTVYYNPSIHGVPNVERFADIWKIVDGHFTRVHRGTTKLEIHFYSYNLFIEQLEVRFPGQTIGIREGNELYQAYTYIKKNTEFSVLVIDTYQPINDNTFIHELLHHYMENLTVDGALNNHFLIPEYSAHVESLIRFMLAKRY